MGSGVDDLIAELRSRSEKTRTIVAIAGAPGSGKSTLAGIVEAVLNEGRPGRAGILPMDGFHYDDAVLTSMERLPWKGAPDTFDVRGLAWTLRRLRESEEQVAVPVFDREIEIARAGARVISDAMRIILVEGNYLLCTEIPWCDLELFYDLTVMIDVPETVLRRRLRERWVHFGLDENGIHHKLEANDIPNGQFVKATSRPADFILTPDDGPANRMP